MIAASACPDEETLVTLALGDAASPPTAEVANHLAGCTACLVASRDLEETLAALAGATRSKAMGHVRARIDRSVGLLDRFTQHVAAVAALLDVDQRVARRSLFEFYDGRFREVMPGVFFRKAPLGASLEGAFAVLARLNPGVSLPMHRHLGDEATLVLQGGLTDRASSAAPGEVLRSAAGSAHEVTATGDDVCCCVVLARGGVTWG